jgi:DNA-binding transcriptional MerR regulator
MEYTVQKLSRLAGVSPRTLRYYDEIGILKPARINSSGYRIYGQREVDLLQQIMFYRELGLELSRINEIISNPSFDMVSALIEHRKELLKKRKQLDLLIKNVDKTIASIEGRIKMSNREKFEGFKQEMIAENERKYGSEIREKYGEESVTIVYTPISLAILTISNEAAVPPRMRSFFCSCIKIYSRLSHTFVFIFRLSIVLFNLVFYNSTCF